MTQETAEHVAATLRDARSQKGWTQGQLAAELGTSQSAVARMEQGKQNLSLKMIQRLETIFGHSIVKVGTSQMTHLRVEGGRTLSGAVDVNSSKNAGVALLCASLINRGTTVLRRLARIEHQPALQHTHRIFAAFRFQQQSNQCLARGVMARLGDKRLFKQ